MTPSHMRDGTPRITVVAAIEWLLLFIGVTATVLGSVVIYTRFFMGMPWLAWKMVAATGFVLTGLGMGGLRTTFGRLVVAALVFCWIGDLMLSWRADLLFHWPWGKPRTWGIAAFLTGHVLFAAAFALRGLNRRQCLVTACLTTLLALGVIVYVWSNVPGSLRVLIAAYALIISTMVAFAAGTWDRPAALVIPIGAVLFFISDFFVAYGMFVPRKLPGGSLGLPLYFGGVLLMSLAAAVPVRRPEQ